MFSCFVRSRSHYLGNTESAVVPWYMSAFVCEFGFQIEVFGNILFLFPNSALNSKYNHGYSPHKHKYGYCLQNCGTKLSSWNKCHCSCKMIKETTLINEIITMNRLTELNGRLSTISILNCKDTKNLFKYHYYTISFLKINIWKSLRRN